MGRTSIESKFWARFKNIKDPMPFILSLHLYTEYWINSLIRGFSSNANEILEDTRSYTYAVKLNFTYNMNLIPRELFENLKKLNKYRNKYAHDIDYELFKARPSLYDPNSKTLKTYTEQHARIINGDPKEKAEVFKDMTRVTFVWLTNICIEKLKIKFPAALTGGRIV